MKFKDIYCYELITIFGLLFIINSQVFSQTISRNKAVVNPLINLEDMSDYKDTFIVREYLPFDEMTLFTTTLGGQVFKNEKFRINMFPGALINGDVTKVNPKKVILILQFYFHPEGKRKEQDFFNTESLTFLIDNKTFKEKISNGKVLIFKDNDVYLDLIEADSVRARIEGETSNYEIDMSKEIRSILRGLLTNLPIRQNN